LGTITDDDTATLSISDAPAVVEGNSGTVNATFTVRVSKTSALKAPISYVSAHGTAVAPGDYTAVALTPLIFAPGDTSKTVTVLVNGDLLDEANETFFLNLSATPFPYTTLFRSLGTITDDDTATLSISDAPAVVEGNSGTVNATFT